MPQEIMHMLTKEMLEKLLKHVPGKVKLETIIKEPACLLSHCPDCFETVIIVGDASEAPLWRVGIGLPPAAVIKMYEGLGRIITEAALASVYEREEEDAAAKNMH